MVRPGDLLGERYRILEQIGAGGMGTLWRAHHVELDVDVALKVVAAQAADALTLTRFKREARAAAKLRSPNVVQVLDFGEFEGVPYLAMELLKGEDLAQRLLRTGKLPFDECTRIMDGMVKAVQTAHDAGIVHRDLKPANVFLERVGDEEVVKILDFGVAKDLTAPREPGATTAGGGVVGSPAYMSPEQVWSQEVGPRTDVWALGVIAFEMVTGKNPFSAETLAKIFERIIREPLPKPSQWATGLPAELEEFFARALARSPKDRVASAKELGAHFRAALAGEPVPSTLPRESSPSALGSTQAAVTTQRGSRKAREISRFRTRLLLGGIVVAVAVVVWLSREAATPVAPSAVLVASQPSPSPAPPAPNEQDVAPTVVTAASSPAVFAPSAASVERSKPPVEARPRPARAPAASATQEPAARAAPALDPRFGIPLDR